LDGVWTQHGQALFGTRLSHDFERLQCGWLLWEELSAFFFTKGMGGAKGTSLVVV